MHLIDYLGLFPRPHNLHTTEKRSGGHLKVSAKITVHILEVLDLPHQHEAVTPGLVRHGDQVPRSEAGHALGDTRASSPDLYIVCCGRRRCGRARSPAWQQLIIVTSVLSLPSQ